MLKPTDLGQPEEGNERLHTYCSHETSPQLLSLWTQGQSKHRPQDSSSQGGGGGSAVLANASVPR